MKTWSSARDPLNRCHIDHVRSGKLGSNSLKNLRTFQQRHRRAHRANLSTAARFRVLSSHQVRKRPTVRAYARRVCSLAMLALKNSAFRVG
jgi:hypothetical protein